MKLVTVPIEFTKRATEAKEIFTELGKVEPEGMVEHINFGKLGLSDCGREVSFTSLANGRLKNNENYLKWKDGIDVGEVDEDWIEELANEISAIYGNDNITATTESGLNNVMIHTYIGKMIYDPNFFQEVGNQYGMDNILGIIAHEVGHRVVHNIGLGDKITCYENEACADYIAGLTARLCQLNSKHTIGWYDTLPIISDDWHHPGKFVRMEVFTRGLNRIDRGKEATRLKAFEEFSPYDLEKVYQNADLLKRILYQDVIEPLRKGEITIM